MSDSKFDDKIRESLEGHEPNVNPNWDKMRDRIAAAAAIGAVGVDTYGSKIATQLSIGAAVVIGAASMWIAQKFMEVEEIYDVPVVVEEIIEIGNEELTPDEIAISAIDEEDDDAGSPAPMCLFRDTLSNGQRANYFSHFIAMICTCPHLTPNAFVSKEKKRDSQATRLKFIIWA